MHKSFQQLFRIFSAIDCDGTYDTLMNLKFLFFYYLFVNSLLHTRGLRYIYILIFLTLRLVERLLFSLIHDFSALYYLKSNSIEYRIFFFLFYFKSNQSFWKAYFQHFTVMQPICIWLHRRPNCRRGKRCNPIPYHYCKKKKEKLKIFYILCWPFKLTGNLKFLLSFNEKRQ